MQCERAFSAIVLMKPHMTATVVLNTGPANNTLTLTRTPTLTLTQLFYYSCGVNTLTCPEKSPSAKLGVTTGLHALHRTPVPAP